MTRQTGFLVYPHQLFEESIASNRNCVYYLIEEPLFFTQYPFHKKKILLHRASMRAYEKALTDAGKKVRYLESSNLKHAGDALKIIRKDGVNEVAYFDCVDDWLERRIASAAGVNKLALTTLPSPGFLNSESDNQAHFLNKKSYLMRHFYVWQRKRLGILTQNENPVGGEWSFDKENRKRIPKGLKIPAIRPAANNKFVEEASAYVKKYFGGYYGNLENFIYPVTHHDAAKWLEDFLKHRFALFGPYEDAILSRETFLFHSILTPALNIGLLTPRQVVDRTLDFAQKNSIPIGSIEGFIRQIIGWREFIRAVYCLQGRTQRTTNYWSHKRPLPETFWSGNTGIPPVDDAVRKILLHGYVHHIERLMILGNFMLLCEFDPDQIYKWFMTLFIDAYDWVMVPNVYGMSQFADGGLMATKPYISSSNYILKMSNYSRGPWCEVWDALYWRFIHKHQKFFSSQPRLSMMTMQLKRMAPEKLAGHLKIAEDYLSKLSKEI